ncbi:hypothetical protein E2320_004015, partial [Naja naja]
MMFSHHLRTRKSPPLISTGID